MQYGIPFPDIYDWTWGEVSDFIEAKREHRRQELKEEAQMLYKHAILVRKLFGGEAKRGINVIEAFDHLWTAEEVEEMQTASLKRKLMEMNTKEVSGDG